MRTLATQEKYHIRAVQLIFRAKKELENEQLTPPQIAQWLVINNHAYSKATWRQYRAALVYAFTRQIQDNTDNSYDLSTAISLLKKAASPIGRLESRQTSAQKQKKMGESDLICLMDYFNGKPSRHGLATQAWLLSGLWAGLRPCEWEHAVFTPSNELVIINAKNTQGRAHGVTRTLDMADLTEQEQQVLCLHFDYVQQAKLIPGRKEFQVLSDSTVSADHACTRQHGRYGRNESSSSHSILRDINSAPMPSLMVFL